MRERPTMARTKIHTGSWRYRRASGEYINASGRVIRFSISDVTSRFDTRAEVVNLDGFASINGTAIFETHSIYLPECTDLNLEAF